MSWEVQNLTQDCAEAESYYWTTYPGQAGKEHKEKAIPRDTDGCLQEETVATCICPTYFKYQLKLLQSQKSKEIFSSITMEKAEKGTFQQRKLKTFCRTGSLIW